MTAKATGRYETRGAVDLVALTRTFQAPISDVWEAVTESDRLVRWFGTWSGDPASGSVQVRMNAEGEDVPEVTFEIRACEPPHRLTIHTGDGEAAWDLGLELTESGGVTTLELTQVIDDPAGLASIGPGWEYYLDRLVAAQTGADPGLIDFERDYYPALSGYYTSLPRAGG
ncbi:MAG: SRPBCC family protein [Micrococcales bacterium]|nr:SRPBCC family protein [Micrococcales bacterium]